MAEVFGKSGLYSGQAQERREADAAFDELVDSCVGRRRSYKPGAAERLDRALRKMERSGMFRSWPVRSISRAGLRMSRATSSPRAFLCPKCGYFCGGGCGGRRSA